MSGDEGHRGRARSRTFSSEDDAFTGEIDNLNAGLDGKPLPSQSSKSEGQPPKPGLSRKTIDIMTRLDPNQGRPPEIEHDNDLGSDDEEAAAERELAELEKKRRGDAAAASAAAQAPTGAGAGRAGGVRRKKEDSEYDVQVKLLLLGDSGVGKTSLMQRYSEDKFSPSLLSTAGVDYKVQMLEVEGKRVKCQIWDTAGQQRFHVITHSYYKSSHGIVLVYDASEPHEESFNNIRYWMENIQKHASPQTQKLLIGNKIDVKGKKIETSRGKALADEYGMKFFETSAKDGTNVAESFNTLARDVVLKLLAVGDGGAGGGDNVKVLKDKPNKDCAIM